MSVTKLAELCSRVSCRAVHGPRSPSVTAPMGAPRGGGGRGGGGGKGGRGGGRGDGREAVRIVPIAQALADKRIAKVVQPQRRHYNGQGCAQRRVVLPSCVCRAPSAHRVLLSVLLTALLSHRTTCLSLTRASCRHSRRCGRRTSSLERRNRTRSCSARSESVCPRRSRVLRLCQARLPLLEAAARRVYTPGSAVTPRVRVRRPPRRAQRAPPGPPLANRRGQPLPSLWRPRAGGAARWRRDCSGGCNGLKCVCALWRRTDGGVR